MDTPELKELIRVRYAGFATADSASAGGCGPASCGGEAAPVLAEQKSRGMGYSDADLAAVPEGANLGLGCGNPQVLAELRPGEVVVDLGSGAGFDCFLAARQVGPTGQVIGVDMTHEMLSKARDNAAKVGATNVAFRLGEIEHLPVADGVADVVISNCVVNLAPDKAQVFREAFRVLKSGGRVAISDVVAIAPLPAELQVNPGLYCGCASGAAPVERIGAWLAEAGFVAVRIEVRPESWNMIGTWAPELHLENYIASAMISARKP
jgi:SAM-dependent methyltransferase